MILLNSAEKISSETMNRVEKSLGIKFPEDYKKFIINDNGGMPEKDMLYDFYDEVTERENTSVIRRFFSICIDNGNIFKYNLIDICNTMREEGTIANDIIPIADDPLGNPICISVNADDYGVVYYLNHEYEDVDTGCLIKSKISSSFKKFLEDLYMDE